MLDSKFKVLGLRLIGGSPKFRFEGMFGVSVLCVSLMFGGVYLYAAVISKFLPYYGNVVLDAIKDDMYYCHAIPLAILPTYLIVYLNWLCLKLYESN